MEDAKKLIERNLTLTSVVFELEQFGNKCGKSRTFNFNKCCIWIVVSMKTMILFTNLTLTSVVFEYLQYPNLYIITTPFNFNKCCIWIWKSEIDK